MRLKIFFKFFFCHLLLSAPHLPARLHAETCGTYGNSYKLTHDTHHLFAICFFTIFSPLPLLFICLQDPRCWMSEILSSIVIAQNSMCVSVTLGEQVWVRAAVWYLLKSNSKSLPLLIWNNQISLYWSKLHQGLCDQLCHKCWQQKYVIWGEITYLWNLASAPAPTSTVRCTVWKHEILSCFFDYSCWVCSLSFYCNFGVFFAVEEISS